MEALKKYSDLASDLNDLSKRVVDCIFQVHKKLGPGYLEKIYEDCLCIELKDQSLKFMRQYPLQLTYNDQLISSDFRLDIVVENKILIELKAVETMHPVFEAQMYSYLKMSKLPIGLLVNFNVPLIKNGIKRYVPKSLRDFGSSRENKIVN